MKRDEILIDRDNINAKREKIINLFNETMTDETNEKKKRLISFEIVTTADERKIMMKKKVSVENDDFQIFETFVMKNSIERISAKFVINDTTTFLSISENLLFNFEKFLK